VLTLTKPVSRAGFVLAKIVSQAGLLIGATVVSTAVCAVLTAVIFGQSPLAPLVTSVSIWTLDALLMVVVMTLFSAGFAAPGASAGAGLGFFFLTVLISIWPRANRYSFVGLTSVSGKALRAAADWCPLAGADGVSRGRCAHGGGAGVREAGL
jgi:ABC-2 type transport system permease protein